MGQQDKRSQVCGMYFMPLSEAEVKNYPGKEIISVRGRWLDLKVSSGEYKEKQEEPGGVVEQELKAVVADTGADYVRLLRNISGQEGLVLIRTTNGGEYVVGTEQFPVTFSWEYSGSPLKQIISFKRNSSEGAKKMKSF